MAFYLNFPNFSKTAFVLAVAIGVLTGCDNANQKSEQKPNTPPVSATVTTSATANFAPVSTPSAGVTTIAMNATVIDPKIFAGHETAGAMAVAMSAFITKNINEASDLVKLPADKKSCVFNSNHVTSLPIFDGYLAKKLTGNELKKTNAFYASEVGQKLISLSDQKIKQLAGLGVPNPVPLSQAETESLKAFASTPEGKKLMALFSPANQLEMQREIIEPMMKRELENCHIQPASIN